MDQNDNPKLKIRLLEIRTHIHATEDPSKIQSAILNIIGIESENLSDREMELEQLTGSFSNPIGVFALKLTNKAKIEKSVSELAQHLSLRDKNQLNFQLEKRVTEKLKLFFRIEKQELVRQKLMLARSKDVIQIILSIQNKTPYIPVNLEDIRKFLHDYKLIEEE